LAVPAFLFKTPSSSPTALDEYSFPYPGKLNWGDKMGGYLLLYIFAAFVLFNYFFVSKERFRVFFPTALCVGLASEVLAILIFSKLIPLFSYINLGKFGEEGFPIFVLLGWIVLMTLYLNFLPERSGWPVIVYTAFFTIMVFFLHEMFDFNELMEHHFKQFDFLALPGNFLRFYAAYWLYKSGFFRAREE
jgi:hypothetical protein